MVSLAFRPGPIQAVSGEDERYVSEDCLGMQDLPHERRHDRNWPCYTVCPRLIPAVSGEDQRCVQFETLDGPPGQMPMLRTYGTLALPHAIGEL